MSVRRLIVEAAPSTFNVKEFCANHGVSTWFFYDLRRRFQVEGEAVFEPKSRAPHSVANKTALDVEEAIVRMRKELADAGLDAGAESIAFHLRKLEGVPVPSTIWRILKQRGLIAPQPHKAPKTRGRRFVADRANECWGLDDTGWALADGTVVKILNIIDDHSRLLVASEAMVTCTGAATLTAMAAAAAILGWPERFLSDNAKAFRDVLATAVAKLGVGHGHTRPYHPQTNGKVERFHQTLKKWLRQQPPAETLEELQAQLDLFRILYNTERPHRGIDREFPADRWTHAPKAGPKDRALHTPSTFHHKTVRDGKIRLGTTYEIALGVAYNGQPATAITTGTACHVFINGQLVRELTINPTRKYQPRHDRPGRPRLP